MISHWEEFKAGPNVKQREQIYVTLNERGMILLNRKAFEVLGKPEAVALLFDKVNSKIGIRRVNPRLPNAFPVARKGNNAHSLVFASSFCRHYGVQVDRTAAFTGVQLDNDGILTLDLRNTISVAKKRQGIR